jgi:hypothetical protein
MKITLPNYKLEFSTMAGQDITDQYKKELNLLIETLRSMGVKVYEDTNEFDPEYPYLMWDKEMITQCKNINQNSESEVVDSAVEFLSHFNAKMITRQRVKINESYEAIVTMKGENIIITVGCQTIPVESVERLNEVIAKLKKLNK